MVDGQEECWGIFAQSVTNVGIQNCLATFAGLPYTLICPILGYMVIGLFAFAFFLVLQAGKMSPMIRLMITTGWLNPF